MKRVVALTVILGSVLTAAPPSFGDEGKSVIAGSGTCIPIVRLLAREFQRVTPGFSFDVPASIGSGGGVHAAADGTVEIGIVSRELKPDEGRLGLIYRPFARTAVILAADRRVPDAGLTRAEIAAIYRGEKKSWKNGRSIVVLTREPEDSSIDTLKKIPGFAAAYDESIRGRYWSILYSDQEMNRVLALTADALGVTDCGAVGVEKMPVKALAIDGVPPTAENVRSGRYGLVKPLAFVYRDDRLTPRGRKFIAFVLGDAGRKVLKKYGYVVE
ncbi:PstS family phosphate ABC transporter substrate-binding protein [Geobacter pickeringii]|uniref:PBP domain-containing protein n=1 Tax=Geobacter pickeringii TaxID=345632 RepID=A0A0B5BID6_9BACT|nr:substrate-binding domain-containing protein [Geobacter pickeringii]AJE04909.1 hypothetical protein GPICK_11555 [Geobacter pickeringii]